MQYRLTAELFPLEFSGSILLCVLMLRFVNQYGNSQAVPDKFLPMPSEGGPLQMRSACCFVAVTTSGGLQVWL